MTSPTPTHLWTCDGKGGAYELLGPAQGAGTSRATGMVLVYRDLDSGLLYFRTVADFIERMRPVCAERDAPFLPGRPA